MLKVNFSLQEITTIAVRFISIFMGFFTSILTARFLGPEGRGEYFFVTTLVLLLTQFATLGLSSSNTYFVAKNKLILGKLLANSWWVSCALGIVVASVTLFFLNLCSSDLPSGIWAITLLVPTSIFYLLGTNLLIGIDKIVVYNFFQFFSNLLLAMLLFFAGISGLGVSGFLVSSFVGWFFSTLILFIYLKRQTSHTSMLFDFQCFTDSIPYGLKAYIATLMGMLVLRGNVLILKSFSTEDMLGYYSVAAQLSDCLGILPASVGLILFPNLVRNIKNRREEMKSSLYFITILMTIACITAAVVAKPFILFVYGAQYISAVSIFWCMLPGAFFLSIIVILSQYLAAIGFPRTLVVYWIIAFIIMIVSSFSLIPLYSSQGAALSLSLTYGILLGLIFFLIRKLHKSSEEKFYCESLAMDV